MEDKNRVFFLERFDDDDDNNNRRVINYNASVGQHVMPMDEMIRSSPARLDFETTVLRLMMSRRFHNQTRFRMAARYVISQVGMNAEMMEEARRYVLIRCEEDMGKVLRALKNRQMNDVFRFIKEEHPGKFDFLNSNGIIRRFIH